MILGYNQPRPLKENYLDFQSKLVKGLKQLEIPELSLMIYGSFVRGDYDAGRSDIDGVLEFPDNVVIDKTNLDLCSRVLEDALSENHIPFQVSVCDRATLMDGRFNPYTSDFEDYFKDESVILVGKDIRKHMKFKSQKSGDLHSLSFNLRKSRTGLLFSRYRLKYDYEQMLREFNKTLDSVSRGSKQILHLIDGEIRKNRFSAIERIKSDFPEVDIEPLKRIKRIYEKTDELDFLYAHPEELLPLWNQALTTFEQIVRAYITQNTQQTI